MAMRTFTYSTEINKPREFVFDKIIDQSVYADWTKAWGGDMTFVGDWKEGTNVTLMDKKRGGTKVLIEEFKPGEYIRAKHIAMVNSDNIEIELTDDNMRKWIGSVDEYYFEEESDYKTTLKMVLTVDEVFQQMYDDTWPKALQFFKEVCES